MRRWPIVLGGGLAAVLAVVAGLYAALPVNVPIVGLAMARLGLGTDRAMDGRLRLPEGFVVNRYASDLGGARLMQLTPDGDIIVSTFRDGGIVLVRRDGDGDGRSDGAVTLAEDLDRPHGLWLEDDGTTLYVAEEGRVVRYRYDGPDGGLEDRTVVLDGLPEGGGHSSRTVKKGPDGWFYVSIGSSCNVCVEEEPWRAAILRFRPGEGEPEIFATGLRNTVGFDWQPGTGALYGVDNGRDWLGDDFPPDELNRIEKGGFYGWPFFNGDNVKDPDTTDGAVLSDVEPLPPVHGFAAHVAALSIRFLRHPQAPGYANAALVGQHGSWNRSTKIGYRVVSLHWGEDGTITQKPFLDGFLRDGDVAGRPVDVIEAPDGTIYVSDDYAGAIYRVRYEG
ncbi:PQQ-dependent sugar dehydrogenase [Kaustia mangrovi]|uniref:PQQ-dependent sugar dehydrogenase n=1 Tax=Kaustia mangrovi TaxID=2593653 RepID=A0A7S8C2R0_9HYPH|nr:PQQ-dependent sugar dehydrogenase [Kaustia mangrovi]QPC42281.1 PQQ-dependent sugar dehydrogenase [Kaustia mangrovi]